MINSKMYKRVSPNAYRATITMRSLIVLCAVLVAVYANHFSYDGYKVYRIYPTSKHQVEILAKINDDNHLDFWSPLRYNGKPIDVMVDPKAQPIFGGLLHLFQMKFEIFIQNVETIVQEERARQSLARSVPEGKISFTKFNRFDEINAYLDQLAVDHSDIVTVQSIGKSYEERDLKIIQISTDPSANKPIIFVDAGIHAREWIAPAQAEYIIQQLVEVESNRYLLEKVDWHILPVMNPDGYEYTFTDERFWRKTRSPQAGCFGTDGNRNFGFHWGEVGASDYPCDDTYMGPEAFSEIESQHVRDYILGLKERMKLYLTFHAYGNYLLYPWGFTSDLPEDDAELRQLAEAVNKAIVVAGGDEYEIGTSTNVLYAAAGGSDDWAKGVAGIQLSYTIELPAGGSGFDPYPYQILPFVRQTFAGIKVYGDYIGSKFG